MAIDKNLFPTILSMDAYNRGYDEQVKLPGDTGTQIGDATILQVAASPRDDQPVARMTALWKWAKTPNMYC